jgi:hypothetical protein
MNTEIFLSNNEPASVCAKWNGKPVIDIGLTNRCAWASAKQLISFLIHDQGEVQFSDMQIGGCRIPTLDLFLDEPAKLAMPVFQSLEQGDLCFFANENAEVGLFSALPPERDIKGDFLAVTKDSGLVASVFRAYLQTAGTVAECTALGLEKEAIVWGWSSVLLAPLCDSLPLTLERQKALAASGSIISLWVRHDSDETIKALMRKLSKRGELRLQNLKTGNTFILGSVDQVNCAKIIF